MPLRVWEVNGVGVEIMPISGDACFSRAVYKTFHLFHPQFLWFSEERTRCIDLLM